MTTAVEPVPQTFAARTADGHEFQVIAVIPSNPQSSLLWLSAMGVASRNYIPLAREFAAQGIAVFLHEWRGNGSSSLRASRKVNWGYREILEQDLPQTQSIVERELPGLPRRIGGHSLGGQLACCYAGLNPDAANAGVWLACSGSPYYRCFPVPHNVYVRLAYYVFPLLAKLNGHFPGKLLSFAGNEAAGMMRDWSRTALTGVYAVRNMGINMDELMAQRTAPVTGVVTTQDWLAPKASMEFLQGKFTKASRECIVLNGNDLGLAPDHFTWMKSPKRLADEFLRLIRA